MEVNIKIEVRVKVKVKVRVRVRVRVGPVISAVPAVPSGSTGRSMEGSFSPPHSSLGPFT